MIKAANPDVVGLVEATDPHVVEVLAQRLEMQYVMSVPHQHSQDWEVALLSRLPILYSKTHFLSHVLARPVLEAGIEEPGGKQITLFVTHLSAAFNKGRGGEAIRRHEVRDLLRLVATKQGTPHLIMGDFNALAPGDAFKGSFLLRNIVELDQRRRQNHDALIGYPHLDFVVPGPLRIFNPLLRIIPRSKLLCTLFDRAASVYAPRGCIGLLRSAGYVDCFRKMNRWAEGFTCPAVAPAGRIDFVFASPELAESLSNCYIPTEAGGIRGDAASDHLPVVAEFGELVGKSANHSEEHNEEIKVAP
jgi:endonuclease/exonuclease/phosphatase family metal-dependent hydrolase